MFACFIFFYGNGGDICCPNASLCKKNIVIQDIFHHISLRLLSECFTIGRKDTPDIIQAYFLFFMLLIDC